MQNIFFRVVVLLLLGGIIYACSPRIEQHFLSKEEIRTIPVEYETSARLHEMNNKRACKDYEAYMPDTNYLDHFPIKQIRINFHWMNSADSSQNYNEKDALYFTKGLLHAMNYDLNKNNKMWLPHNNDTPVLPNPYRLVLTPRPNDPDDDGIYFHFDDELYYYVVRGKNANLYDREVFKKYGVQLDTVLNIFIMPHHPDSVASPTYAVHGTGIALGNSIKVAGIHVAYNSFWGFRGTFNHEVGHILGLSHTWAYNDGCDDTPQHDQQCWNRGQGNGCDSLTSNNVMDYNAMQHAWSPCQVGKIQMRLSDETSRQRKYLIPNWCELHEDRHIHIRDTIVWAGMKDLEGHLTIEPGGMLTIKCRVSLPKDAKITVKAGGTLIVDEGRLHNACGDQWQGIEIEQIGSSKGAVTFLGEVKVENVLNEVKN